MFKKILFIIIYFSGIDISINKHEQTDQFYKSNQNNS